MRKAFAIDLDGTLLSSAREIAGDTLSAMANSSPELLSIADYVTKSNDADGVGVVLRRMLDDEGAEALMRRRDR